jgi:acyl carrier protein
MADVKARMAAFLRLSEDKLADDAVLTDLVTESFILVEMVMELQHELGIRLAQDDLKPVRTVGDLVRVIESKGPLR